MTKPISSFHIIALCAHGTFISGGDRIWIELTKRWSKKFPVIVHTWKEGVGMAERQTLFLDRRISDANYKDLKRGLYAHITNIPFTNLGFLISYLARIIAGIYFGLTHKLRNENSIYLYSASEFWMDSLPCVIFKMRYPKIRWIATWYQTAPNPLKGFAIGKRDNAYKLNAFLYWLSQLPIKPLVKKYADKVIVNNEDEKKQFPELTKRGRSFPLIGAVPSGVTNYIKENKKKLTEDDKWKKYDAIYHGRFHAQKGVVELVKIWKLVVAKRPKAKVAMVGDGALLEDIKLEIKKNKLERNVLIFNLMDGPEKFNIMANSKIVVHPAFFDSGGMASADVMAFGIPCVGFDLPSFKSYYPVGMVKVKLGDLNAFANAILDLLENNKKRREIGKVAGEFIEKNYSWDTRAEEVLKKIYV